MKCPNCGQEFVTGAFGRRSLNLPVTKVRDALQRHNSVLLAAEELGCSRGYIYKVLKTAGLTPAGVINGLATKDTGLSPKEPMANE